MNRHSSASRIIAVPILTIIYCAVFSARVAIAQTCGAAGCTSGPSNYDTNQGGNAYYCLDTACQSDGTGCHLNSPVTKPYLTIPANTDTLVAADDAGAYSDESWNYGVSGQALIANADPANTALVTMTIYYGSFCAANDNSCFSSAVSKLTLHPSEAAWIPFTTFIPSASPDDGYAFFVLLKSTTDLHCLAEAYYTWEHD